MLTKTGVAPKQTVYQNGNLGYGSSSMICRHHLCHNPLHYVFILRGLILLHIPQSVGMWQLQLSVATQQLLMAWQLHKAARLAWSPCNGLPGLAVVQVILEYEMQSNGCIK
ncbi:hypothetical protein PCANC_04047 [Puccinia coronata f. sp. avenae]|uniref:Uncharacterized protein n=1 Tax=Puccinia coronata f. sp. avenae TaxID=200324 RepID=A0A2N5W237_9BASI|nr:hypothetical protein PCASD_07147 [Puccinia coronata f. sp. avenae]PLW56326.1 hypothetical protein PCANC_04047 [Puccinia coronata f. sp. avenae]